MQNAPGKNLILVPGILYIVFSGISVLAGLALGGIAALAGGVVAATNTTEAQASGGALVLVGVIIAVVIVAVSAVDLIIGIIAVRNANKPEKAKNVITVSYILIALAVLTCILSLISAFVSNKQILADVVSAILSLATGLVLPILIMVGGKKNQGYANSFVNGQPAIANAAPQYSQYAQTPPPPQYGQPTQMPGQPSADAVSPQNLQDS